MTGGGKPIPNKIAGDKRENIEFTELKEQFPDFAVQRERLLRTADGKKAIDPVTGTGRRIDFAVIDQNIDKGKDLIEVTSKTADKSLQTAKELRIRSLGGVFIRDKKTRKLINIKDIKTRLSRRD